MFGKKLQHFSNDAFQSYYAFQSYFEKCCNFYPNNFTINSMKKTGLKRVVIFFSVDFNLIDTNDVIDIDKCLMRRI